MNADPNLRPSWFITIAFALVVALFSGILAGGLLALSLPDTELVVHYELGQRDPREKQLLCLASACAALSATLAAAAFRLPDRFRFHISFLAGVAVLGITAAFTRHIIARLVSGDAQYELQAAPLLIAIATAMGLILILAALSFDRSTYA